jgi:hypothetical protein
MFLSSLMVIVAGLAGVIIATGFEFSPHGAVLLGIIGVDAFLVGRWSQRRARTWLTPFDIRWASGILVPTGIVLSISGGYCATRGFGAAELPELTPFAPLASAFAWIAALFTVAGALLLGVAVGRVSPAARPGPLMTPTDDAAREDAE